MHASIDVCQIGSAQCVEGLHWMESGVVAQVTLATLGARVRNPSMRTPTYNDPAMQL
jgi:hypothetical protein